MKIKNKIAALTILTAFNFANVQAASVDSELAIIAAEQPNDETKTSEPSKDIIPKKKSRSELKAEEKRLKAEQKAAEKKQKEEMKAAEKEVREAQKKSKSEDYQKIKNSRQTSGKENFPTVDPVTTPVDAVPIEKPQPTKEVTTPTKEVTTFEPPQEKQPAQQNSTPPQEKQPVQQNSAPPQNSAQAEAQPQTQTPVPEVRLPNPIVMQSNFDDLTKAVNFVPLYIPKKSGFSINSMMALDGRIAEIRYGRRWEPEVSLNIRTYKRINGEETKDISGVNGVKWRVDMTSGITVYIAKISENKHVAAWAVGDYTFSAQAENLSFAAFHAIVADELVDLSQHYYVK